MKRTASRQYIYFICAGLFCFIAASVLLHSFSGRFGQETELTSGLPDMEETIDVSAARTAPDAGAKQVASVSQGAVAVVKWVVYVTGSVKNPGVYEIPVNSRVYQALEAAGGFTGDADRDGVNLAAPLQDGTHIRFPGKNEKDSQPRQPSAANTYDPVQPRDERQRKLNLNTCTAEELKSLPGVGPKTAELILVHRKTKGSFGRVEDLLLIKGIGPKKYDAIRELVTVEST